MCVIDVLEKIRVRVRSVRESGETKADGGQRVAAEDDDGVERKCEHDLCESFQGYGNHGTWGERAETSTKLVEKISCKTRRDVPVQPGRLSGGVSASVALSAR